MPLRVLVLGGCGFIGQRVADSLCETGWADPLRASRRPAGRSAAAKAISVDARDLAGLTEALRGVDAVVNCVGGGKAAIADGARQLVEAAERAGCRRIVHLSSMAVYGAVEGVVTEDAPLKPDAGWYGLAKAAAEAHMTGFTRQRGEVVILRLGCVAGPGSQPWVARIGRLLRAGRIGDLGLAGDGWSNLLHVDDVSQAVTAALRVRVPSGRPAVFNLTAPDSPRWNEYFTDLALAIRATPLRRVSARRLQLDAYVAGPPLKIAERLLRRALPPGRRLPDALVPSLLRLWSQEIRLDSSAASRELRLGWTAYRDTLRSSVEWMVGGGG
jgi:nucleoside-diphosphate-sugar epimerase